MLLNYAAALCAVWMKRSCALVPTRGSATYLTVPALLRRAVQPLKLRFTFVNKQHDRLTQLSC